MVCAQQGAIKKANDMGMSLSLIFIQRLWPMRKPKTLETLSVSRRLRGLLRSTHIDRFLMQALLSNILAAKLNPRCLAIISSRVGSVADDSSGESYVYKASKTAVNPSVKTFAVELKEHVLSSASCIPGLPTPTWVPVTKAFSE